jgi:hypothetical protein
VPTTYKTDEDYRLGRWVLGQRTAKDTMDLDRRQRLEALPGWSWDVLSEQWEEGFSYLKVFSGREGHCRVPLRFKTDHDYLLGSWVRQQRAAKDIVDLDRRQRLEALPGWSWDVLSDQWEEGFSYLKHFSDREGHCRVPLRFKTDDDYRLGRWVSHQREAKDEMDRGRRQRLQALPGWSWDVWSEQWEDGFCYLKQFANREGHCRVPRSYKTNDSYRLGPWVSVQRADKEKMEPNHRQRLEALPGWTWYPLSEQWEEGFSYLKHFSDREGHCRVVISYKTNDGYRLGQWVSVQRRTKNAMNLDRQQRLEALPGWSWDPSSDQWEVGFSHLKQFADREGHCRVPASYKTDDDYRLGQWVTVQRTDREKMEPNRRQRLEALPGWSWDALSYRWEEGFSYLTQFASREGHCRVLNRYKTDDGYWLGNLVSKQRGTKNAMDPDRQQRLEALPGWVWKSRK